MSSLPEPRPERPLAPDLPPAGEALAAEEAVFPERVTPAIEQFAEGDGADLFKSYIHSAESVGRIPNLGHLAVLALLAAVALLASGLLARAGIYFHLFGVKTVEEAGNEIHYTLGVQALFYLFTFLGALLLFPAMWQRGFFEGLQWRGRAALRHSGVLFGAAAACFVLALVNGWLMPGPSDTPIDKIFRMPGAPWILFGFGVTFAPFFEEMAFRGFLLPALSTSFDWMAEKAHRQMPHPVDKDGHPRWSMPAMIVAAIITSILFALLHADQTAYSIGPFLLLVSVSLVLCWARLGTRSLAASVLVHACYNLLLFTFMYVGTGGFRHLDSM